MKITFYTSETLDKKITYETDMVEALGFDDDFAKEIAKEGGTPMLSFVTKDGRNVGVPVNLLVGIKE